MLLRQLANSILLCQQILHLCAEKEENGSAVCVWVGSVLDEQDYVKCVAQERNCAWDCEICDEC